MDRRRNAACLELAARLDLGGSGGRANQTPAKGDDSTDIGAALRGAFISSISCFPLLRLFELLFTLPLIAKDRLVELEHTTCLELSRDPRLCTCGANEPVFVRQ